MIFNSAGRILHNNIKLLKELHSFDRSRLVMTSIYWICDQIEILIYNVFILPFLYYAVDNSVPVSTFLIVDGVLILLLIICDCYQSFYNTYYIEKSNQLISHNSSTKVFHILRNLELKSLYDPNCKDSFVKILNIGTDMITAAFDMVWWAISVVILGVCYIGIMVRIDALLIIVAVLSAVSMFFLNMKLNKLHYQNIIEGQKINRKIQYVIDRFSLYDYTCDLQTTDLKNVLKKRMYDILLEIFGKIKNITQKMCNYTYLKNIVTFLVTTTITWIYLSLKYLLTDSFSLGIAEITVAVTMMQQLCDLLINLSTIGPSLNENSMYAEEYFQFINREPDIKTNEDGKTPARKANSIRLSNICFSYDGKNDVLKNVNMTIGPGEKIAIVGRNGAGKSTILKILLRLYAPQEGNVEMDGESAEVYKLREYRDRFGVAFQDTNIYAVSVLENVMMSPCDDSPENRETAISALKSSKLYERIESEQNGIDSICTKEFDPDGIELSGGQAQKLALARVFAKDCGIVVLDEPSAALDPISEAEMYETMLDAMADKTVILISHRLSACRNVDRIYVIEDGKVAEEGSHEELLANNGLYAQMWEIQASGYRET